jgi:putative flippase GtrA
MISYAINALLLEVNVSILHLNVFIAQFFAVGTAAVATYIMFKKFAFKST